MPRRIDRRRSRISAAARISIFIAAAATVFVPTVRTRLLLTISDAWSAIRPPGLQARATTVADLSDSLTPRERRLIAECLKLRAKLNELQPSTVSTDRLVQTNPVIGQVLWTHNDGRSALLKLGATEDIADMLVVADNAIDVGQLNGVEVDGLVLAGRSVIGRVDECGLRSCSVKSVTSTDFRVTAEIVRPSGSEFVVGARGMYEGDGGSAGLLKHIAAELPVSIGDEVFTTPGSIWSGQRLHLGTITQAELPAGEPHWRITVTPSGQLTDRSTVYVLRSRVNNDRKIHRPDDSEQRPAEAIAQPTPTDAREVDSAELPPIEDRIGQLPIPTAVHSDVGTFESDGNGTELGIPGDPAPRRASDLEAPRPR